MALVRKKPTIFQTILLLCLGTVSCLLLLEVGIRVGGFIFISAQEYRNRTSLFKKGYYRIMCLGESTTAGQYPPFLDDILNQRNIGVKFTVIDKGVVGINSIAVLSRLEENLDTYKPDMVITMIGINDQWITYYRDIPEAQTWVFRHCRVYRFLRLISAHMVKKFKEEGICGLKRSDLKKKVKAREGVTVVNKQEKLLQKIIALKPKNAGAYIKLGEFYQDQNKLPEAEESFNHAIALNPKDAGAYIWLGGLYRDQNKLPEAEESFKRVLALNHQNNWQKQWGYRALGTLYREMNNTELAKAYNKKATNLYTSVTINNYRRIKALLDKRGIRLVCVQYPMRSGVPLKRIFEDEQGVLFVDNEQVFKKAITQGSYRDYFLDMFGGDFGHCTKKGNMLLAENIAKVILQEVFGR